MKVILVDDEQLALDFLQRQLEKIGGIEVVGAYVNPFEGKKHILQEDVDVIFLDINLPEINGIELAEQILEEKPNMTVIFITAYDEYAVKAFELHALDYIVKPVKIDRLSLAIKRVQKQMILNKKIEDKSAEDTLRIKVCQYPEFEVGKDEFATISWRTARTQELFFYLLQNRGRLVRKSTLVELLWSEYDIDKVYSLLYTTIYNVRKRLKTFHKHFILKNTTDGYILETHNVIIDIEEWEKQLKAAPVLDQSSLNLYLNIMKKNRGPYLQMFDYVWAESERYRLDQLWITVANQIAQLYEESGELEQAISWYNEICKRYQETEHAHFSLMKIYAQIENNVLVHKQFNELKRVLKESLNVEPSDYIVDWYQQFHD